MTDSASDHFGEIAIGHKLVVSADSSSQELHVGILEGYAVIYAITRELLHSDLAKLSVHKHDDDE
jgi:hypothetical protein